MNNLGLVVNFVAKTVSFAGFIARITEADAATMSFEGEDNTHLFYISGSIDRVTGALSATSISNTKTSTPVGATWDLLCKPTTRLF